MVKKGKHIETWKRQDRTLKANALKIENVYKKTTKSIETNELKKDLMFLRELYEIFIREL